MLVEQLMRGSRCSGCFDGSKQCAPTMLPPLCSYRSTVDLVAHGNAGLVGPLLIR